MRALALVAGLAAALVITAASLAGSQTTTPGKYLRITVVIQDKAIVFGTQQSTKHHGDFIPLGGPIPRGDFMTIHVYNRSATTQTFAILGKKTSPIKPGGTTHLSATIMIRGKYVYKSTSGTKSLRGSFIVA